jgi:6,7-dimethyl-8-ribityllumazine synthase
MAGVAPKISTSEGVVKKVAIISAQWHPEICEALIAGAKRALEESQVKKIKVAYVPGSFELPLAAQYLLEKGYEAAVVVGLVLKGETPHFDYVCQGVTAGVVQVQLSTGKPIGFGVLMCDNLDQANARAGLPGSFEDKGYDAAKAALATLALK